MHILFAGGGTAGHINPALSVAKYLQENYDNVKISYIGTEKGLESRLVREAGYDFYTIEVSGFQRKINFERVFFPPRNTVRVLQLIWRFRLASCSRLTALTPRS